VLQIISGFEDVTGISIPYRFAERRAGDVAECWADAGKAERELGWSAQRDLTQMLIDSWRWQSNNPRGYSAQPAPLLAVGMK
jgi:UDP-glucose 4-epimerase